LRLGPNGFLWGMGIAYAVVTLGGILAFYGLVRDLTGKWRLALALALWLCVSPAVLLYSQKLYYDGLVPWLLTMAVWGVHAGAARRSIARMAFGFSMLAAAILLRSMIHPALFVAVLGIYAACCAGQRARVLAAGALPGLAIALVLIKNAALFGVAGMSSWLPLNLDNMMVDRLPLERRAAMVRSGDLSRYGLVPGLSPPMVYVELAPKIPPTGEPSLDSLRKSSGEPNWNHRIYLTVGKDRTRDALAGLRSDPAAFSLLVATGFYFFHLPPSAFTGLERNRSLIAPWDRVANMLALQPAAWAGLADDVRRSRAPLLWLSFGSLLESLAFVAFAFTVSAKTLRILWSRRWPDAHQATLLAIALIGTFVVIVSALFDVFENNRAHYDIGSILRIGAIVFVLKLTGNLRSRFGLKVGRGRHDNSPSHDGETTHWVLQRPYDGVVVHEAPVGDQERPRNQEQQQWA
ncbi:MAG TPA: hypothetical protein VF637_15085, partial [Sphingomicrobium sp.]